ncbi:MAG TPA: SCP2 sterol-binding domain-containing protein [Acidimicrobiales bacterium]|nr:SCP2 sterol-binding domain-containing protein [Acidimicrobiales bacterium]
MPKYPFLTPEWVEEAKRIREEFRGQGGPPPVTLKMNVAVSGVPFGESPLAAHLDSTGGEIDLELGHLDDAEVTVTVPYELAESILVGGDAQAGIQAFMAGRVAVSGDMTKLMAMLSAPPDETTLAIRERIQAMTGEPEPEVAAAAAGAPGPARYAFLSPEWVAEAQRLREEMRGQEGEAAAPATVIRMNQVITDVPFGDGTIQAHMDSSSGQMEVGLGHIDEAEVQVTVPYDVAQAIFVEGDAQVAMQAFMAGRIKVQGDMTKLMAMQAAVPNALAAELRDRIRAITADVDEVKAGTAVGAGGEAAGGGEEAEAEPEEPTTFTFLSPEWMAAVERIRAEAAAQGGGGSSGTPIRMNQTITGVPFGEGTVEAHLDSSSGTVELGLGHMEGADVTITLPYPVAKAIFVDDNRQAGMQAFMAGQLRVEGDMTKLMAMQGGTPSAAATEVQQKIRAITAD